MPFNRSISNWKSSILTSWLNLLYPPLCLHCGRDLPFDYKIFCQSCFESLEFTSPCSKTPSCFYRILSPFEKIEQAETLQNRVRQFSSSFLTEAAGALMALHYLKSNIPKPDIIIPLPSTWLQSKRLGYCPALEIARVLAKLLDRPLEKPLYAKGLFTPKEYLLKKPDQVEDRTVLLVAETLSADFYLAGEALMSGCPKRIIGTTLTASI